MKKIYIIGNPLVEEDSLPLKLKNDLQITFPHIEFKEFDPSENFPDDSDDFCLIDSVKGIQEPLVFTDIDQFINKKGVSMHDFDLGWEMKLMKKAGKLKKVFIIGVPQKEEIEKTFQKIIPIIEKVIVSS